MRARILPSACATLLACAALLWVGGCDDPPARTDAGAGTDAGPRMDAGDTDAGTETDSGTGTDAGPIVADCTPRSGTTLGVVTVASGIPSPVFVAAPPGDPRLWVLEQQGRVRLIKDGALLDTPFLDIRSRVGMAENEQGLLGLAFHPRFATNGLFYVHYSDLGGDTVIAEYTVDPGADVANMAERRILTETQPYGNHNGGMITFGPDGYLYIGLGDGGSGGDPDENGEDTSTLLGSILRIDVDGRGAGEYSIPADNPLLGAARARGEIWAYGLRNPWRFSFDSATGDLWIGDVGQNVVEEVDFQPASSSGGENYGWNTMEGTRCFDPRSGCDMSGRVLPVAEYLHSEGGCSITGGYVYRGACMPDLQGQYFYADFCSNRVWTMEGPASTPVERSSSLATNITSFGVDGAGELYIVSRGGTILRVVVE